MTARAYDEGGTSVALGPRLGRGGEGEVFLLAGDETRAAKILYPTRRIRNNHEKIKRMVERPPTGAYETIAGFPVLTWPRAILYSSPNRRSLDTFLGYTMERIQPRDFVPIFEITSAGRRGGIGGTPVTWDRLVLLALRLCHVVRTLHRFGYAIGDLNDRNVLVSRRFTPLLMDTDSFQVPKPLGGHYPSIVGDQMYWAPELLDVDLARYSGDRVTGDRFALGVLLFQLFMNGNRPYQSRGARVDRLDSLAEKTRAGHFPWASPKRGVLEPPAAAPAYRSLPPPIRYRFEETFVAGHHKPRKRPTVDEWYETLLRIRDAGYKTCAKQARHVFGKDAGACPWCADSNNPFTPSRRPPPTAERSTMRRAPPPRGGKPPRRPAIVAHRAMPSRRSPYLPRRAPPPPSAPPETPRAARTDPPLSDHPSARALWMVALLAAFLVPTWWLRELPQSVEKMATTAAVTIMTGFGAGVAASWRLARTPRGKAYAAGASFLLASLLTALLAGTGHWEWLDYTTGAASFAMGLFAFLMLERRRVGAFRPSPKGLVHGAMGLPPAYLPVAALWLWVRL